MIVVNEVGTYTEVTRVLIRRYMSLENIRLQETTTTQILGKKNEIGMVISPLFCYNKIQTVKMMLNHRGHYICY